MAYSGRFIPKNLQKYKGNWQKITYRSNWEKALMGWLDANPAVVRWNSEEVVIPYFSNADGKKRRYFMDFWVRFDTGQEFFFEVKPAKETKPPVRPSKMTSGAKKRFINEHYTWCVNVDKWTAAQKLAEKHNVHFRLLTEVGLRKLGLKI
ncbi:decorative head protein [Serratia phage Muldoon]|uniref:Head completion nuclease n=1 Tax=Serratia phage Muldoon TaxID=2601678 RepID=A0A5P8PHG7_9CAUD|nr:head closure [Serratia phage Muldoon]QFR56104.1 decorative head protein [Serratia phage Muldoon]WDS61694.1 head completion protein [Cronobacter phage vB_Cdu_VP8]